MKERLRPRKTVPGRFVLMIQELMLGGGDPSFFAQPSGSVLQCLMLMLNLWAFQQAFRNYILISCSKVLVESILSPTPTHISNLSASKMLRQHTEKIRKSLWNHETRSELQRANWDNINTPRLASNISKPRISSRLETDNSTHNVIKIIKH